MGITQKCQYALRALFELAKRSGNKIEPAKISDIAEAQKIPPRFLEVILNELKQGGFADSRRGKDGGYFLKRMPHELTVGEVIRFVQGPIGPVDCVEETDEKNCPLSGTCVFLSLWQDVEAAVANIYDSKSFQDLLDEEKKLNDTYIPNYMI